jgi:tetratricopeptide (TPR) repeat protein
MTLQSSRQAFLVAAAALIAVSASLGGIYMRPDIEEVPVARLVANLEKELAADPKNPDIHLRLARLYAVAYSANTTELPATVLAGADRKPRQEVWFGHEPDLVPQKVDPGATRSEASKGFLAKSVEHYHKVVELNPSGLVGRIGYAWTLEQSGNTAAAVAEYRRVVEQAWAKEEKAKFAEPGQRFFTEEAARHLIPLLDPKRDAEEIATLRARAERLGRVPRAITPIAIPLADTASPKTIVDLDASVPFDADGTGLRKAWTWISPDAAWLVYDATNSGRITSALQLFGNVTFWNVWGNGYEPLRALDDDGDGELRGRELRHLALWRDVNRDAVSDPGEVRPLSESGIVALTCRGAKGDGIFTAAVAERGVRFSDGRTRPTYDVILRRSISVSAPALQ